MKWILYLVASALTCLAAYPAYVRIDTGFEGVVGWITATLVGGWFFGLVGNLFFQRWKVKHDTRSDAATADAVTAGNGKPKHATGNDPFVNSI